MYRVFIYSVALFWVGLLGAESFIGATRVQLEQTLGEAGGVIDMADSTLLVYERGFLTLRGGVVVREDMMSPQEYSAYLESRESSKNRWMEIINRRNALMHERALELKRAKLRDPNFLALPLKEQIEFWGSFKAANPDISIEPHYTQLIQRFETLMDEHRTKELELTYAEKLAVAQERVAEAEARAARAEAAAARARQTHFYSYPSAQPLWVYPTVQRRPIINIQYENGGLGVEYNSGSTTGIPIIEVLK